MKRASMLVAVLALVAAPAFAEEGRVSKSALNAIGLSGMQEMSDTDGMNVRGMAIFNAQVKGTSLMFFQLLTPDTKNFLVGSSVNEVDGDVNANPAAVGVTTLAKDHNVFVNGVLNVSQTGPDFPLMIYTGTVAGTAGGFGTITLTLP